MTKKIFSLVVVILMVFSMGIGTVSVVANMDVIVKLDGEILQFDVAPCLISDRTMVPLRAIFEALGATVEWNDETKTVTAYNEEANVKCTIGSNAMYVNEVEKIIDVAPMIVESRTLVPVRFIAESFNCGVSWDGNTKTVYIISEEFVQDAIVKAARAYKPYDKNALMTAQEIISNALKVLPENDLLQSELQKYKDLEPISLLDLEVNRTNSIRAYFREYEYAGEKKDTLGNSYSTTIVPSDWLEQSDPFDRIPPSSLAGCEWKLDYQYSKITGTVCFDAIYVNAPIEIELTIMNSARIDSGSKKVFMLNSSAGSKSFDVDLTGAKTLYLGLEQSDKGGTYAFLTDVYLWK